jgi:hypothetical protein
MKEITPLTKPTAAHGLNLIVPAYKSAFVTIGEVWLLLAFGAFVAITISLFEGQSFDDVFPNLGVMMHVRNVLFWASPAIMFFIYLVVSAKIWTVCFNAQNPEGNRLNALFGVPEKAAFCALIKLALVSCLITLIPLTAFAIFYSGVNFLSEGAITISPTLSDILFSAVFVFHQLVMARYLFAVPMSIADSSSGSSKSVSLDQAWQRTKDWYPIILMALIPITLLEQGVNFAVAMIVDDAAHDGVSLSYLRVAIFISHCVTIVITGLATLHVILGVWSQMRLDQFDQQADRTKLSVVNDL